jgi:hypothetical protein
MGNYSHIEYYTPMALTWLIAMEDKIDSSSLIIFTNQQRIHKYIDIDAEYPTS